MILNLTQHDPTPEQIAAGVVAWDNTTQSTISKLLTFEELPTDLEIADRAYRLATLAAELGQDCTKPQAMIGGAPFLMSALERHLVDQGVQPVYAFSVRRSTEQVQSDGTVIKVSPFRHLGFVTPPKGG